jgi:UDPglucose 6-dehydrogenase/GDP-mannose 6-dehydrogenase
MKLSVIGTGYVGLVSGVCLAELGHRVVCVDIDRGKVDRINRGLAPIYEPGLEDLLSKNIGKNFSATTDLHSAVIDTDLSLITVGTPYLGDKIDLTYIRKVSQEIGAALRVKEKYHVVAVKSTVVPGTTDQVVLPILENASGKKAGPDFGLGMNPEFLREGEAVSDFMAPDRIVLGAIDEKSLNALEALYGCFTEVETVRTNTKTAEMIKYTSNCLLATLISFSNEIANLCSAMKSGVDVVDVMRAVHLDKRLSPILDDGERITPGITQFIEAGCGFGGSCFPKDVRALISYGEDQGQSMNLMKEVIRINERQPDQILHMIDELLPDLNQVRIGILGLAFKPGTDDIRESPALPVVQKLLAKGAAIKAFDPVAAANAQRFFNDDRIEFCDSMAQAVDGSAVVVLMTRWGEFARLPELLEEVTPQPIVIDGRRMLDKSRIQSYLGIGLGSRQ